MAYRNSDINIEYPVAGVDNDSQGFRDNFSAIRDGLVQAEADITDLQNSSFNVLNESTDLSRNTILNANLNAYTVSFADGSSTVDVNQEINYENAAYQRILVGADQNFSLAGWPVAGNVGKIVVHLYSASTYDVTFTVDGGGDLYYDEAWPVTLSVTASPVLVEFTTFDAGSNVYAKYLGTFSAP